MDGSGTNVVEVAGAVDGGVELVVSESVAVVVVSRGAVVVAGGAVVVGFELTRISDATTSLDTLRGRPAMATPSRKPTIPTRMTSRALRTTAGT
jgi:hypothetical protein